MLRNLDSKRSAEKLEKGPSNFRAQRRHKGAVYRLDTPVRLLTGFGVACMYNIDTAPKREQPGFGKTSRRRDRYLSVYNNQSKNAADEQPAE